MKNLNYLFAIVLFVGLAFLAPVDNVKPSTISLNDIQTTGHKSISKRIEQGRAWFVEAVINR